MTLLFSTLEKSPCVMCEVVNVCFFSHLVEEVVHLCEGRGGVRVEGELDFAQVRKKKQCRGYVAAM